MDKELDKLHKEMEKASEKLAEGSCWSGSTDC